MSWNDVHPAFDLCLWLLAAGNQPFLRRRCKKKCGGGAKKWEYENCAGALLVISVNVIASDRVSPSLPASIILYGIGNICKMWIMDICMLVLAYAPRLCLMPEMAVRLPKKGMMVGRKDKLFNPLIEYSSLYMCLWLSIAGLWCNNVTSCEISVMTTICVLWGRVMCLLK